MVWSRVRGYNLIEVMVAIAILAILARLAVPAYNTYRNKGYIAEAWSILATYQKYVEERCNSDTGDYNVFGLTSGHGMVDSQGSIIVFSTKGLNGLAWNYPPTVTTPSFRLRFSGGASAFNGGSVYVYMVDNGNCNISWVCENSSVIGIPVNYLPPICSATNTHGN